MTRYWCSWWHDDEATSFELITPWWITGCKYSPEGVLLLSVCAAIEASDKERVEQLVQDAYRAFYDLGCGVEPGPVSWRFIEERGADWAPFNDRFKRMPWMEWP